MTLEQQAIRRAGHHCRIIDVASAAVPVTDQERAVRFYRDALGLEVRLDVALGDGGRWVQVGAPGGAVPIALVAAPQAGVDTGLTLASADADADHAALAARGVDVDELLRWPGVPPMFAFRDLDGNQLKVMEVAGATGRVP